MRTLKLPGQKRYPSEWPEKLSKIFKARLLLRFPK